jgi:hypothetical protein
MRLVVMIGKWLISMSFDAGGQEIRSGQRKLLTEPRYVWSVNAVQGSQHVNT